MSSWSGQAWLFRGLLCLIMKSKLWHLKYYWSCKVNFSLTRNIFFSCPFICPFDRGLRATSCSSLGHIFHRRWQHTFPSLEESLVYEFSNPVRSQEKKYANSVLLRPFYEDSFRVFIISLIPKLPICHLYLGSLFGWILYLSVPESVYYLSTKYGLEHFFQLV